MSGIVLDNRQVHSEQPPKAVPFILASASPRRNRLLKQIITKYTITPGNINEKQNIYEAPLDYVLRMSKNKGQSAYTLYGSEKKDYTVSI